MKTSILALAGLASTAFGADFCGQWDTATMTDYTLYQDLWGEDNASSGSQCTTVDSDNGDTIAWHTSWSWSGGSSDVKSYANAAYKFTPKTIGSITSIPTTWDWSYTGSDIVADVSYDMFADTTSGSSTSQFEIMVWLAAYGGAGPISSTGSADETVTIGGVDFKLYDGFNGDMHTYSYVATSDVTSFSGDLLDFLTHIVDTYGTLTTSHYLNSIGAGTEPFTGSNAVLTVSKYSVAVN